MEPSNLVEQSARSAIGVSEAFGALGDPARYAVLRALRGGTRCVCELAPMLGMAPNLLSYHLRILREAGLIEGSRRGRRIEYRIRPGAVHELVLELIGLAPDGEHDER